MPENDHVHSRLTHSIEVADVGKSLGKGVGKTIIDRYPPLQGSFSPWDFGFIVSAACLAHDIGNPPFGHAGEQAISKYFRESNHIKEFNTLNDQQQKDLQNFEGNAQGFRILTKKSTRHFRGGMRLTLPVLAAFTKYPQNSLSFNSESQYKSENKYGFFESEQELYKTVATNLSLKEKSQKEFAWYRHPLAFLTEAADDICYNILDLEDGFILGLIQYKDFENCLMPIAEVPTTKLVESETEKEKVSLLRALSINNLVKQTVEVFLDREADIVNGNYNRSLISDIKHNGYLKDIKTLSEDTCYLMKEVVKAEIGGKKALNEVLNQLSYLALSGDGKDDKKLKKIVGTSFLEIESCYEKLLSIIDFVSGMTDRYTVSLYRQLYGIELPTI